MKKTIVYRGLGFPITLVDVPLRRVIGNWIIDINMEMLQRFVLRALVYKLGRLNKNELVFIRKFFRMTTTEFGRALGVSHVAVVMWEKGQRIMSHCMEFCVRLNVLMRIGAKVQEIRDLSDKVSLEMLSKAKSSKAISLQIDVSDGEFKLAV